MSEKELTESGEDPTLGLGALGSIGGGRDPGHIDTLQGSVSKIREFVRSGGAHQGIICS
jgi:hypothetical protein